MKIKLKNTNVVLHEEKGPFGCYGDKTRVIM